MGLRRGRTHWMTRMCVCETLASRSGHEGMGASASDTSQTASNWRPRRSLPTAARRAPSAESESVCMSLACCCRMASGVHASESHSRMMGTVPSCADAMTGLVCAAERVHTSAVWPMRKRCAPVSMSWRMRMAAAA